MDRLAVRVWSAVQMDAGGLDVVRRKIADFQTLLDEGQVGLGVSLWRPVLNPGLQGL